MEILLYPFMALSVLTLLPFLALVPAGLFFWIYRRRRERGCLWIGAAWVAYCLYEYGMKFKILCSGECNIRVDLILIYPLLLLASFKPVVAGMRKRRASKGQENAL